MDLFRLSSVGYCVKTEQEEKRILDDINLTIPEGIVFTIIGPSGSGKSTLLMMLNRLLVPTSGNIEYRGKSLGEYEPTRLRSRVGLVLQKPHMLPGSVEDNLMAGPRLARSEPCKRPEELLQLVGLSDALMNREARSLSGGEQQRVSLARTLANGPDVLLLDEVTSALNQASAEEIEELVAGLVRREGINVVWVTHDLSQARRVGDVTALLLEGRVAECAPTEQLFASANSSVAAAYLKENWQTGGISQ